MTSQNTPKTDRQRAAPRSAWRPGQSGNPGGRPRGVARVYELARAQTEAAIQTLVNVMQEGTTENARVRAAEALLDRAWGKTSLPVEVDVPKFGVREALAKLSVDELKALKAIKQKLRDVQNGEESSSGD